MKPQVFSFLLSVLMVFSGMVHAALFDRGQGLIYDDVLDITWLQDANYAGSMDLASANQWAENLVYEEYDDWRLPTYRGDDFSLYSGTQRNYRSINTYLLPGPAPAPGTFPSPEHVGGYYEIADTRHELANLFYNTLGNTSSIGELFGPHGWHRTETLCIGTCFINTGPFFNINHTVYLGGYWTTEGLLFFTKYGEIGANDPHFAHAVWAVRPGDVITPIPSTVLLFVSGFIALLGLRKKRIS